MTEFKPIVVDIECTIFQKGSPHCERNRLCYIGLRSSSILFSSRCDVGNSPYGETLLKANDVLLSASLFVAFNAKFDWNWCIRYGLDLEHLAIWDLQLAHFIIHGQSQALPSLSDVLHSCGLGVKPDYIRTQYWDNGIDTPDIPEPEMLEYLDSDLDNEWDVFQWQMDYLKDKPKLKRIIWDACQDLKLTAEMERNGLKFDKDLSIELGDKQLEIIADIDDTLNVISGRDDIFWNSNDWLSAVLYGGTVYIEQKLPFEFTYKDGRTKTKLRTRKTPLTFDRLVEPLKGTELKKQGFFEVNEGVLKKLRAIGPAKQIVDLMLRRNKIEKLVGTYLHGFPKLYDEMDWKDNIIHGQLIHVVAKTGRLSSSKPNQQNTDKELSRCLVSRFQNPSS